MIDSTAQTVAAVSPAATDLGMFAATQAAAQSSVASAAEMVKSGAEATMSAGEMAIVAGEAAGAVVMATVAGFALPVVLGGIGLAGLAGAGYYAWNNKGFTVAGLRKQVTDRMAQAQAPGQWPQWEGHNYEAIWNDDALLEAATRPEPTDELGEINWDELALECA